MKSKTSKKHRRTKRSKTTNVELVAKNGSSVLSPTERSDLTRCETVIGKGLATFMDVGLALAEVRDKRLYREKYRTFEQYIRVRWKISRPYAYSHIGAAQIAKDLSAIADIPQPTNESQLRPLLSLPTDKAVEAWKKAAEKSNGKGVTARIVREAASEFASKSSRPKQNTGPVYWKEAVSLFKKIGSLLRRDMKGEARDAYERLKLNMERLFDEKEQTEKVEA